MTGRGKEGLVVVVADRAGVPEKVRPYDGQIRTS